MLVLKGKRKEIYEIIRKNPDETIVLIKVKPSVPMLAYLLSETKVRKIYFTPGILKTVKPKILEAIRKMNVHFQLYNVKRGPPYKTTVSRIKQVFYLVKKGFTVQEACRTAELARRTFYYRIKKMKLHVIRKNTLRKSDKNF